MRVYKELCNKKQEVIGKQIAILLKKSKLKQNLRKKGIEPISFVEELSAH
jgi:hypothetical protein